MNSRTIRAVQMATGKGEIVWTESGGYINLKFEIAHERRPFEKFVGALNEVLNSESLRVSQKDDSVSLKSNSIPRSHCTIAEELLSSDVRI